MYDLSNVEVQSINGVAKSLGYNPNHFYMYYSFSDQKKSDIEFVCFKIFSTEIIFIGCTDNVKELIPQDVEIFLKDFDFNHEYSTYNREKDLKEAIENKSLSIEFMADVLNFSITKPDQIIVSDRFGYKFIFKDGFLSDYSSIDGLNKWSREWKESSSSVYDDFTNLAKSYWKNDKEKIIEFVNIQADAHARAGVDLISNDFHLSNHIYPDGNYNFKMLLVALQNEKITLREFKDINLGDFLYVQEVVIKGKKCYAYGACNTLCIFDETGNLVVAKDMK